MSRSSASTISTVRSTERGLNNSEAFRVIEEEIPESYERSLILDFVRTSERGIVRGTMD